jgi:hypothetical protein
MHRPHHAGTRTSILEKIRHNKVGLFATMAAVLALGLTSAFTLGGFSATIDNSTSTFSSATLQLEEGNGVTTCYSTGAPGTNGTNNAGTVSSANTNTSCAINVLTGTLDQVPGGTALTATITLTNVGSQNASIGTLVTGACTVAAASDNKGYEGADTSGTPPGFCNVVDVTIANTTSGATDKCVYPTQAAACPALSNTYTLGALEDLTFTATTMSPIAAGASATYVITDELDSSATNADQGLTATVPFTWSISA